MTTDRDIWENENGRWSFNFDGSTYDHDTEEQAEEALEELEREEREAETSYHLHGVEVKIHGLGHVEGQEELGESRLNEIFEHCQEEFWHTLDERCRADEEINSAVYSEGRSSGWAITDPPINPKSESNRFAAFEKTVREHLNHYVESVWPLEVETAIRNHRDQTELRKRQTQAVVTITWAKDGIPDKAPPIWSGFMARIIALAFSNNGFKNFEVTVEPGLNMQGNEANEEG